MVSSKKDITRLRELAKKQLEYAHSPEMEKIRKKWITLGESKTCEPIVRMAFPAYRDEIITPRQRCEGEFARALEHELLANMAGRELFDDDSVVPEYYQYFHKYGFSIFSLKPVKRYSQYAVSKNIGYHIEPVLTDLKNDLHLFEKSGGYHFDREAAQKEIDTISEIIGDILPVRRSMAGIFCGLTQPLVALMGMETMYMSMVDYPDEFHQVMNMACENYEAYFDWLMREKLFYPTNSTQPVPMDTYTFTNQLPGKPESTRDIWGYNNNQESVAISPDMFGEFVFPYVKRLLSKFGLVSYGCCEPVHPVYDRFISTLANLKRVSVSAWCDEEFMGERLRGTGIVYHRKPKSTFFGPEPALDEDAVREYFTKTALAARGCIVEITQREVLTIYGNTQKVRRYIALIRETVNKYWKP